MTLKQIAQPFLSFFDKDGLPLDNGFIYIGVLNSNPEAYPIQVYWDSELKYPAVQPIRTMNGYPSRNGVIGMLYSNSEFSILIRDKDGQQVIYSPVGFGINPSFVSGTTFLNTFSGDSITKSFYLTNSISSKEELTVIVGGIYQLTDSFSIEGNQLIFSVAPPIGTNNIEVKFFAPADTSIGSVDSTKVKYQALNSEVQTNAYLKFSERKSAKDYGKTGEWVSNLKYIQGSSNAYFLALGKSADGDGGDGVFYFKNGDMTTEVASDPAQGVYVAMNTDPTGLLGAWIRQYSGAVKPQWFGTISGIGNDRIAIQAALDFSKNVFFPAGDYGINYSGQSYSYHSAPIKVGLELDTGHNIMTEKGTVFKVFDDNVIAFVCYEKENITFGYLELLYLGTAVSINCFGIYFYNCNNIRFDDRVKVHGFRTISVVFFGSTNIIGSVFEGTMGELVLELRSVVRIENSFNVNIDKIFGKTSGWIAEVLSEHSDVGDINIGLVKGINGHDRSGLIILDNSNPLAQRLISNININVESGEYVVTSFGANLIVGYATFDNVNLKIRDSNSNTAFQILAFTHPNSTCKFKNCSFDITAINSLKTSVIINNSANIPDLYEDNKLKLKIINPNISDVEALPGAIVSAGNNWVIDSFISYEEGKTNVGSALVIGGSTVENTVTNSIIKGLIKGGNYNVDFLRSNGVLLDDLILENPESDVSLNFSVDSIDTIIGTVKNNYGIIGSYKKQPLAIHRDSTTVNTGGSTAEVDLMSYTVPANTMGLNGALEIKASGNITGGAGTKRIRFYWGSVIHAITPVVNITGGWTARALILSKNSNSLQQVDTLGLYSTNGLLMTNTEDSEDTTAPVILKFTGQTSNGGDLVNQTSLMIKGV